MDSVILLWVISLTALNTLKNEQKRLFNQAFGKYIDSNVKDYQSTMNEAVRASVQSSRLG